MNRESIKVLRLRDMVLRREGGWPRRLIHLVASIALRLFFRRIEASGIECVPHTAPLIFVLNHPNGAIDPALAFCALPRSVAFLAKSTLFRIPVVSAVVRIMGALPVYRRIDPGEDARQNLYTFRACHARLARGRCIALFPEGVSHDSTQLLPIKTGAARIALGALSFAGDAEEASASLHSLAVMPVGLYYTSKTSFRSEALIRFGRPFEIERVEVDESGEPPRDEVQALSNRIASALREVTLNTETVDELEEINKAEQLFSSIYETIDFRRSLTETFNVLQRLADGNRIGGAHTEAQTERLRKRINRYEEELRRIGITPDALSISAARRGDVAHHFLFRIAILVLLSPFVAVGALVHLPAYALSILLAWRFKTHGPDTIESTVKILAATFLMPLTWIAVAVWIYLQYGWLPAALSLPLVVVCGYVALRTLEELYDMRGWLKAVLILLRRRGLFLRLLLERRILHHEIGQLVKDEKR
ncbi:MAG TPA: 1-acyl-sn-glycerol-3-phosphate acyltransferase [Pyrinomonadaceae bacterium]|jgi:1-acyl-sn-glycerol-3-phosphate acyltransferase